MGSSIAPSLPAHSRRSEHIEARTEKEKGPKQSYTRLEEKKERLEYYEDDDDENLSFTNDLKAMEIPLNDIRQNEGKTVKSYFKRFNNVINKIENVTDEKASEVLVTGFHMHTPFWRDVQNSQPKTYSQLVDLVQREIRSEEMIENRKKAERERGDRYKREGRHSPILRFNCFQKRHSLGPRNNHYRRFNQIEVVPTPHLKTPTVASLPVTTPPKFCRIHMTRVHNTEDC
ncbi:hypothetical protein Adt_31156 [Abeliophyllum distichum]|uniref:Retrotransposon gag domain-containing protein n=1 Tax=Abeliophyllum distichum TaxID=126358 RepID=A0ABD1RDB8_9LAMI